MATEQIPTEMDWGPIPFDDLDVQAAFRDFYGKSNADMQTAFSQCIIEMVDDLRWMPPKPFYYYMQGLADFVMNGNFHKMDAADVASTFLGLVEEKLERQPEIIAPLMDMLLPVVSYLASNQHEYRADVDIYGDFAKNSEKIKKLWKEIMERKKN